MKPKSAALRARQAQRRAPKARAEDNAESGRATRLPAAARRALIIEKASEFFSEYGLTAQTRALADACGVSQRLLYRLFPNKEALLSAVYEHAIAGPFKAVWLPQLQDRSQPIEQRLHNFYEDYFDTILTRQWLRLFLYSSLADTAMAPDYISAIVMELTETIATEVAVAKGLRLPQDKDLVHEIGWALHGNISHLAIRRHLYQTADRPPIDQVIRLHVDAYLGGFAAMLSSPTSKAA